MHRAQLPSSDRRFVLLAVAALGVACKNDPPAAGADANSADSGPAIVEAAVDTAALPTDSGGLTWSPLSGGDACGLHVTTGELPVRSWSGPPEYRRASAGVGEYNTSIESGAAGDYINGAHVMRLVLGGVSGSRVQQVFRVADGKTLALVEQRNLTSCAAGGPAETAPLLLPYSSSAVGIKLGRVAEGKPIEWTQWLPYQQFQSAFMWRDGVGYAFRDGSIRIVNSFGATAFTAIDTMPARVYSTAGRGDVGVWSVWDSTMGFEVLKGFAADVPVRVLVSQSGDVKTVAQSDEILAWVLANGPESASGKYASVAFYTSPRPSASVTSPTPTKVVDLGSGAGFAQLRAGGDYLAATGCNLEATDCGVYVAQISAKKSWRIPHRVGKHFSFLFSIANDELIVGESDDKEPAMIESLVRIDPKRLDDVVKGTY